MLWRALWPWLWPVAMLRITATLSALPVVFSPPSVMEYACSRCEADVPKADYSKAQLKKGDARKCKSCVALSADGGTPPSAGGGSSAGTPNDDSGVSAMNLSGQPGRDPDAVSDLGSDDFPSDDYTDDGDVGTPVRASSAGAGGTSAEAGYAVEGSGLDVDDYMETDETEVIVLDSDDDEVGEEADFKANLDMLKQVGNDLFQQGRFQEAVIAYSDAIKAVVRGQPRERCCHCSDLAHCWPN